MFLSRHVTQYYVHRLDKSAMEQTIQLTYIKFTILNEKTTLSPQSKTISNPPSPCSGKTPKHHRHRSLLSYPWLPNPMHNNPLALTCIPVQLAHNRAPAYAHLVGSSRLALSRTSARLQTFGPTTTQCDQSRAIIINKTRSSGPRPIIIAPARAVCF